MTWLQDALDVLGLPADATEKDIRRAYARLAKLHRPDTDPERFSEIRAAYETAMEAVRESAYEEITIPRAKGVGVDGHRLPAALPTRNPDDHESTPPDSGYNEFADMESTPLEPVPDDSSQVDSTHVESDTAFAEHEFVPVMPPEMDPDILALQQVVENRLQAIQPHDQPGLDALLSSTDELLRSTDRHGYAERRQVEHFLADCALRDQYIPFEFLHRIVAEFDLEHVSGQQSLGFNEYRLKHLYEQALELEDFKSQAKVRGSLQRMVYAGASYFRLIPVRFSFASAPKLDDYFDWVQSIEPARPDMWDEPTWQRWQKLKRIPQPRWYTFVLMWLWVLAAAFLFEFLSSQWEWLANIELHWFFDVLLGLFVLEQAFIASLGTQSFLKKLTDWLEENVYARFSVPVDIAEMALSIAILVVWGLHQSLPEVYVMINSLLLLPLFVIAAATGRARSLSRFSAMNVFWRGLYVFIVAATLHRVYPASMAGSLQVMIVLVIASLDRRILDHHMGNGSPPVVRVRSQYSWVAFNRWWQAGIGAVLFLYLLVVAAAVPGSIIGMPMVSSLVLVMLYLDIATQGKPLASGNRGLGYIICVVACFGIAKELGTSPEAALYVTAIVLALVAWELCVGKFAELHSEAGS